jgi:hypothetical protein
LEGPTPTEPNSLGSISTAELAKQCHSTARLILCKPSYSELGWSMTGMNAGRLLASFILSHFSALTHVLQGGFDQGVTEPWLLC